MKCMKKERNQDHTSEERIMLGRKSTGFEVQRERERGVQEVKRQVFVKRDQRKRSLKLHWIYLQETRLDGSRAIENLSSSNSRQINLLRCVENLSMTKNLDGSRSYREIIGQIETFSMDRESVEKLSRQILESFDGLKVH